MDGSGGPPGGSRTPRARVNKFKNPYVFFLGPIERPRKGRAAHKNGAAPEVCQSCKAAAMDGAGARRQKLAKNMLFFGLS